VCLLALVVAVILFGRAGIDQLMVHIPAVICPTDQGPPQPREHSSARRSQIQFGVQARARNGFRVLPVRQTLIMRANSMSSGLALILAFSGVK
jgi:hypothetical protein